MCLNPIRIRSPKFKAGTFINGCDKEFLDVPCGHCPECNMRRVNNLVFRCFHEYLYTQMHGGFTLMQTLTYQEGHVPFSNGFRFFCKSDVQKFLKRLRKRLHDDGYNVENNLKYVVTSEYGETKHRPHYHVMFYSLVPNLTPVMLDRYIILSWQTLGDRYNPHSKIGIVDLNDVSKRIVNSIYGIRYICKYIFKGTCVRDALLYNPISEVSKYVEDVCQSYYNTTLLKTEDFVINKIWQAYLITHPILDKFQLMPFYLQSQGLGISFLNDIDYDDLFDVVQLPTKSFTGFCDFAVPNYYIRKVFYTYHPDSKRFTLNDLGKDYKKHTNAQLEQNYYDTVNYNRDYVDSLCIKWYKKPFETVLNEHLNGRSLEHFISYAVYLKDRHVNPMFDWLVSDNKILSGDITEFCKLVENDVIEQSIMDDSNYIYNPSKLFDEYYSGKSSSTIGLLSYKDLPPFKDYDILYSILQRIKREVSKSRCFMIDEKNRRERDAVVPKSVLNPQNAVFY